MNGGCLKAWDRINLSESMEEDLKTVIRYNIRFALAKGGVVGWLEPAANGLRLALVLRWIAAKICLQLPHSAINRTRFIQVDSSSALRDPG